MAVSFKRVAAFSNVQQHGEISIIHLSYTFTLILFLPCFFDVIHSFSMSLNHLLCFYISVFRFSIYCLHVNIYIFLVWDTTQDVRSEHNCLSRSFWEISTYEMIFQTFSFQGFTFPANLPWILMPNSQTRHFPSYAFHNP